jgi:hypothetical protein
MNHYQIHRFEGYVDGRESWMKVAGAWGKTSADAKANDLRKQYPQRKFRVRKSPRRR